MEEVISFPTQKQIIFTTKDIVKNNLVLNDGRIVKVDYHKIGQETSSTVGKISRFFVLMFTLTLVDLYDTRGRTAYKDCLKTDKEWLETDGIKIGEEITFPPQQQIIPTTNDIVKANLVLKNKRVMYVDYHKIGQDTSSTLGKISRFFVLMFTLNLVDLYDTSGRAAYKDWSQSC